MDIIDYENEMKKGLIELEKKILETSDKKKQEMNLIDIKYKSMLNKYSKDKEYLLQKLIWYHDDIIKASTFNVLTIGNNIAMLISLVENKEYTLQKLLVEDSQYDYTKPNDYIYFIETLTKTGSGEINPYNTIMFQNISDTNSIIKYWDYKDNNRNVIQETLNIPFKYSYVKTYLNKLTQFRYKHKHNYTDEEETKMIYDFTKRFYEVNKDEYKKNQKVLKLV